MKDLILTSDPAGTFVTVTTILTHFVGRQIHEVITAMARLGDVEIR